MARRPTTRSMCAGLLVFSTSKNIAWRVAGRRRSGPDGGTRAANTGSGVTRDSAGPGSGSATGNDTGISGLAATTAAETAAFAVRRRRLRAVVVRSMPASYGTRRRPARRQTRRGGRVDRRRRQRRAPRDADEPVGHTGPPPRDRAAGPARSLVLLRDGNRRRRLQAPRDIRQGPMHLPEHVHDAAEGLGHRRALASQCIELALEGTMDPAKLSELPAEPLALLFPRFERTTQAVALLDQRRNHVAELVLAFRQPPGSPLR